MALIGSLQANLTIAAQVRRINDRLNDVANRCKAPVKAVLIGQADLIAQDQRDIVAVDPHSKEPGAAKASIRVEVGEETAKKSIVVKIKAGDAETHGDNAGGGRAFNYVRALEFGTMDMNAEPFFYPPYRARKKAARAAVNRIIKQEVSKVFE
jgi:HK97 gp10 family phage protein